MNGFMGTGFDCFAPLPHRSNPAITGEVTACRPLLTSAKSEQGLRDLSEERRHDTLVDEPCTDRLFDVTVQ